MITLCRPMPPTSHHKNSKKNAVLDKAKKQASLRASKSSQKGRTSRGLVRIIAGKHRARRLPVLVHEGLRPTSDRVKETLFNWLMMHVQHAHCLDMYAGSGGLGIEAISRGAEQLVFIEQDKKVAAQIKTNLETLKEQEASTVLCDSALRTNLSKHATFNIVFIDPPFADSMVEASLQKLISEHLLAENAFVYIETAFNEDYKVPSQLQLHKQLKTGQVNACLYQFSGANQ